ncbi:MAG TPA: MFS transporter [Streptosporangiaceae bacterium]
MDIARRAHRPNWPYWPHRPAVLRESPRFASLWLSRSVSATGTGAGRVALMLMVAPSGPGAVSLVLLCTAVPQLLGPVAGTIADRTDQRRLLAGCEAGQGVIYAIIAVTRPQLPVLLPLVAAAALLAALMSPAGKSSVTRLVPASRLPQANALLGLAFNAQVVAGPAIGGVLAGLAGPAPALALNAAAFLASALLLARIGPLPPDPSTGEAGIMTHTLAGLRYAARTPLLRALVLGTLVFVSFAATDNVALLFLVRRVMHASAVSYGLAMAAFGIGMVAASLWLAARASRRPAGHWLIGGICLGAIGVAATGMAPAIGLACAAQALAGAGNTADLVGTDTLIQQSVPSGLLGRAFGSVYAAAQLASAIAYGTAGVLVAVIGPRLTLLVAGTGMLAGLVIIGPALRTRGAGGTARRSAPPTAEERRAEQADQTSADGQPGASPQIGGGQVHRAVMAGVQPDPQARRRKSEEREQARHQPGGKQPADEDARSGHDHGEPERVHERLAGLVGPAEQASERGAGDTGRRASPSGADPRDTGTRDDRDPADPYENGYPSAASSSHGHEL